VSQEDAAVTIAATPEAVVLPDPPYYDNICYGDLSDFFYVWLRRSLEGSGIEALDTVETPKAAEIIASPYRHGGSASAAEAEFHERLFAAFRLIREVSRPDVPMALFYAFKQAELAKEGLTSTGWETMLSGLIGAGFAIVSTWPVRTERDFGLKSGSNVLASSIVIACRPRRANALATTRRDIRPSLRPALPKALRELQQSAIAPVDLAQAAIGPGMAVFTRYARVLEADGSELSVRTALALINQVLDEVLTEQEGDFVPDTRFCVKWFAQFGWDEQPYGRAEELSRATNTSVEGLVRGGIFWARAGKARLLTVDELDDDWDPLADDRVSEWEVVVRLAKALDERGVDEASQLLALAGQRVNLGTAQELAYLMYSICEKKGWTASAALFNGLGTSWSELANARQTHGGQTTHQQALDLTEQEEA